MHHPAIKAHRYLLLCVLIATGCADFARPADGEDESRIDDQPASFAWKAVGAGTYNSCAIAQDGQRYCWGSSLTASCGQAPCSGVVRPTRLAGEPVRFDSVTSGGGVHCGLRPTGDVYCWGDVNYSGTLSLGDDATEQSEAPVPVSIASSVRSLSAGFSHVCAVDDQGDAYCWGSGLGGKLGRDVPSFGSGAPGKVATDVRFRMVSAGTTQTCAVASDDGGYCWGSGYGSLGAGARDTACGNFASCLSTNTPIAIDGNIRWSMISAGNAFTCGVSRDNRGYCWGAVQHLDDPNPPLGTLGNGELAGSKSPVAVSGNLRFQSVTAGTRHACGLTLSGEAYCWGNNNFAELGIGVAGGRFPTPQRVAGGLQFVSLSAADHTCGVTVNQNLYCWGLAAGGRLGNGQPGAGVVRTPTRVLQPAE